MSAASILFPGYRQRVLGLLLLHPESSYHVREIARVTGTVAGTLHRELAKLAEAGIVQRRSVGNQVHYSANRDSPIFSELSSILRKTSGLADVLAEALVPLATQIRTAFVYGSIARGTATSHSDIDVLVIGDVGFGEVVTLLYPLQEQLGREINPKVFSAQEWDELKCRQDSFYGDIMHNPKLFLIGGQHELG